MVMRKWNPLIFRENQFISVKIEHIIHTRLSKLQTLLIICKSIKIALKHSAENVSLELTSLTLVYKRMLINAVSITDTINIE